MDETLVKEADDKTGLASHPLELRNSLLKRTMIASAIS
jgi:hypothetical protein